MSDEKVAAVHEVRAALDDCPYGSLLSDERRRHQLVFETMTRSDDPLAREIGEQLFARRATPRQILRSPSYRDFVTGVLARGESFDLGRLRADLEDLGANDGVTGDLERDLRSASSASDARRAATGRSDDDAC